MNYIKHLTGFFEKVAQDKTLNPTHVSLYIALFQFWNCNLFKNPFSISRDEVMRISKISSKATYHKCMKNLNELGYIDYQPSYNPFRGSIVALFNFADLLKPTNKMDKMETSKLEISTGANQILNNPCTSSGTSREQVLNKLCTSSGTGTEQALVPSINNINNTNNINKLNIKKSLNKKAQAENFEILESDLLETELKSKKEKKLREKKKEDSSGNNATEIQNHSFKNHFTAPDLLLAETPSSLKPTFEEVQLYFTQEKYPEIEAQKFYNYFASIGWLVGGRTPMLNWNAAAANWMLNANKFQKEQPVPVSRAKQLHNETDKNYAEPL